MKRKLAAVVLSVSASAAVLAFTAAEASARCARLGFSVNDYGKEGPTRDAKALLDKHIAKWTADRGITKYTTGKKSVSCKLFLDFGVFDEHTCRAEATVCWSGGGVGAPVKKPAGAAQKTKASSPAESKAAAPKKTSSPAAAPKRSVTVPAASEPEEKRATPTVAPVKPVSPSPSGAPPAPAPAKIKPKAA